MCIAINQSTPVEVVVDCNCHVGINARKYAICQACALIMKKICLRMDVERDAYNQGRIAITDAKHHAIQEKSAQKFHAMLKSESIVNVVIGS